MACWLLYFLWTDRLRSLQVSSTTQVMIYALLKQWGTAGFLEHCGRVSAFYKAKRDMFEAAARRHLQGVADWHSPVSGMFLYLRVCRFSLSMGFLGTDWAYLQLFLTSDGSEGDSFSLIKDKAMAKGVLAVPGVAFMYVSHK